MFIAAALLIIIFSISTLPKVDSRLAVPLSLVSLVSYNNQNFNHNSNNDMMDSNRATTPVASTTGGSSTDGTTDQTTQEQPLTMTNALMFLSTICGALKNIKRTGWVRMGVPLPESDADHMHRCAMCALLVTSQLPDPRDDYSSGTNSQFHPANINGSKLLKMALTHDLCESIAGDITPFCDEGAVASKHDKEKAAMEQIREVVGDPLGKELFELWKEYEELSTPEALYCKDIDKFEMVMQAFEYEKAHLISKNELPSSCISSDDDGRKKPALSEPLRTFYITTSKIMKSPMFQRLDAELRIEREEMLRQRGWEVLSEEK